MNILIADDHALFRDGLKMQLEKLEPSAKIMETENFPETIDIAGKNTDNNLILLDLGMPGMEWKEGLEELKKVTDLGRIVILSASEEYDDIRNALDMGVSGYIPKRSTTDVLVNALRLILSGGTYLPPAMLHRPQGGENGDKKKDARPTLPNGKTLTARQMEVLEHLSKGLSNKQIAYSMDVSEATVKLHINALLRNLEAHNRTQAVIVAQKMGFI